MSEKPMCTFPATGECPLKRAPSKISCINYCEACATTSPLVNPVLNYGPDAVREELRVISVTAERTRVRLVRTEAERMPEEWDLLTLHLPASYAVVGNEFEILCSPEELRFLKGES